MPVLSKDYEMSVCEVKTMDNDLLMSGYVSNITDEYLQLACYKEKLPLLKFELPVKISIHNAKRGFKVVVGVVYISTDEVLRIVNVETLQDFERRAFFRVMVNMEARLMQLPDEFDDIAVDEIEEIPVTVENLSLSGLLFYPIDETKQLFIGDRYMIELPLPVGTLNFNIRIRRYEEREGKPKKYGCEFYNYTQKQSDRLCNYIFEIEREIIRKRKNT